LVYSHQVHPATFSVRCGCSSPTSLSPGTALRRVEVNIVADTSTADHNGSVSVWYRAEFGLQSAVLLERFQHAEHEEYEAPQYPPSELRANIRTAIQEKRPGAFAERTGTTARCQTAF
jgi:hypothetical protein